MLEGKEQPDREVRIVLRRGFRHRLGVLLCEQSPVDFPASPAQDDREGGPDMSESNIDFSHVPWLPREHGDYRDRIPIEIINQYRGMQVAYS
jgi:hypothetical protein